MSELLTVTIDATYTITDDIKWLQIYNIYFEYLSFNEYIYATCIYL